MYFNWPLVYEGVCDVQQNFQTYFDMLVNKCCNLFKWEGLPDTVDERFLMEQLILTGKVCWFKDGDKLYTLNGNVGGEPNVYYEPQYWIVANPVIGSKQLRIRQKDGSKDVEGLDGILMTLTDADYLSDRTKGGLFRLIYQTAGLLADNISSLNVSQINGRVCQLWTVDNDAEARTVEEIVRDMYDGHPYRILSQDLISKIGTVPAAQSGQTNTLLNLIEAHRNIWQNFFSEIGIGYAGNMKRERVNEAEIGLQKGNLDINVYCMLKNLQDAIEMVNKLFETSISVDLNENVFYEESGNANLGETEEIESEGQDPIPQEEVKEVVEEEDPVIEELKEKTVVKEASEE